MRSSRLVALLAAVAAVLAGLLLPAGPAVATVPVSSSHPYSDPIYFPIHGPFRVGCIGSDTANNAPTHCNSDHKGYYASNFSVPKYLPNGLLNPVPHPYIYAAGAGIVKSMITNAPACVTSVSAVTGGNEVAVDHGGGMVSVYQHLQSIAVHVGQLVTTRTPLGVAGASGAECINGKPGPAYLDFQVRQNGGTYPRETAVPVPNLVGCAGTTLQRVRWPAPPLPSTWVKVPWGTGVYQTPQDWNCLPSTVPASPPQPAAPSLSHSGNTITARWSTVANATRYVLQLQIWKNGSWQAPCPPWQLTGCNSGYYSEPGWYTGVTIHNLVYGAAYRVRMSSHTYNGFSVASAWRNVTL